MTNRRALFPVGLDVRLLGWQSVGEIPIRAVARQVERQVDLTGGSGSFVLPSMSRTRRSP